THWKKPAAPTRRCWPTAAAAGSTPAGAGSLTGCSGAGSSGGEAAVQTEPPAGNPAGGASPGPCRGYSSGFTGLPSAPSASRSITEKLRLLLSDRTDPSPRATLQ